MATIAGFAELEAAKTLLLESLTRGVAADDILPALQDLEAFRNSLCQVDHRLIQAVQRSGLTDKHCVSSVEKLVAQTLRISYGDAKRRVRAAAAVGPRSSMLGEPLPPLRPELAAAQAAGEVSPWVVDVIERTLAKVELLAPDQLAETEHVLVRHGTVFEPGELGKVCDRIVDHIDPDGTRPRDAVQKDRRELYLGRCRDGMTKLEGRLTPAASARIRAVLEPLAAPRPSSEPGPNGGEKVVPDLRSRQQRMHDALDEACNRLLRAGDAPACGGTPATVILTITEEQLAEHTQAAARHARIRAGLADDACGTGSSTGHGHGHGHETPLGFGTVETSTGEVLSVAEALRLAAEADIIPIVMTGTGRPLHLGRTRRCASVSQTFALIARDLGCSFPGCTVPPEWCERHHIIGWADGGHTGIDNLTLVCGYHHAYFAQAGWTCTINTDGLAQWRPPPWQDRHRQPMINHRIRRRHRTRHQDSLLV